MSQALLNGVDVAHSKQKAESNEVEVVEFGFDDEQLCKKWVVLLRWLSKLNTLAQ